MRGCSGRRCGRSRPCERSSSARARAELIRARATPAADAVALDDGRTLEGDRIVWCAGGWLAKLFPEFVTLRVTRQELFFFDGGPAWKDAPAWVDFNRAMYGTGDLDGLGVKVAWDQEGPPLDPTRSSRTRPRRPRRSPAATPPIASPRWPVRP